MEKTFFFPIGLFLCSSFNTCCCCCCRWSQIVRRVSYCAPGLFCKRQGPSGVDRASEVATLAQRWPSSVHVQLWMCSAPGRGGRHLHGWVPLRRMLPSTHGDRSWPLGHQRRHWGRRRRPRLHWTSGYNY